MPASPIPAALLALAAPALASPVVAAAAADGGQVSVMTFHERIIMRVPRVAPPPEPEITWKEKRGPRCIVAGELAGALVTEPAVVDLVLGGNRRIRARLDASCPPLDYYAGFYMKPAPDGKVCADRDAIRTRSGASCQIDEFRLLKPVVVKR